MKLSSTSKTGLFIVLLCCFSLYGLGQHTISGTVTSSQENTPLEGCSINLKGTNSGVISDKEGHYSLSIENLQGVLVFSMVGFYTQEVELRGQTTFNIRMQPNISSLDQVVVIGYGTQKRSDLTGAIGSVNEKTIEQGSPANIQEALAGKVAGVQVNLNSGRPGGKPRINIRGFSSITGSNDPLYVIDGVILDASSLSNGTSPIEYINPDDIKSIDVLKDASASAIYGARGANGVIIITTKRYTKNESISYSSSVSFGKLRKKIPLLNSKEFLEVEDLTFQNAAKYGVTMTDPALKRTNPLFFDDKGNPLYDTDWQEEGMRTAVSNSHQLSFGGGNEKSNFGINLGLRDQNGILKGSSSKSYSGRFYVNSQITEWLSAGGTILTGVATQMQPRTVGAAGINPTRSILQSIPIIPVRYPDGEFADNSDYPGMEGGAQPVKLVEQKTSKLETNNTIGNAYLKIKLPEGFSITSNLGTNIIHQATKSFAEGGLPFISDKGDASIDNFTLKSWQLESQINYTKSISENNTLEALLASSWQRVNMFSFGQSVTDLNTGFFQYNNLGSASIINPPTSEARNYDINSYFSRVNYSIKKTYLFTLTGRFDGSSRFAADNQYGFFPSAAFGWILSNEGFLKNSSLVSNLKLRMSYGITGNSQIPDYRTVGRLGNYSYIFNGVRTPGIGISSMGNSELKWEKDKEANLGVNAGILNNKITLEADVYYKKSSNILLEAPIPGSSGYTSIVRNIGSMENKGFELTLSSVNIEHTNFRWVSDFNISINRNKILHLVGGQDMLQGANAVLDRRIIREGEPVNSFYGFVQLGTWGTDEADKAAKYNRRPGDIKYKDMNDDGFVNQQDLVIIGNGLPKEFGSLINTFRYKNIDLVINFQYSFGNQVEFGSKGTTQDRVLNTNVFAGVLDAWTPDHQNTNVPQIRPLSAYLDRQNSSARIYNGSFVRAQRIYLGYNFPSGIRQKFKLENLRVYAAVDNLFLITKYPGYDPEVSTLEDNFSQGVDVYSYPKPRTIQIGFNITL